MAGSASGVALELRENRLIFGHLAPCWFGSLPSNSQLRCARMSLRVSIGLGLSAVLFLAIGLSTVACRGRGKQPTKPQASTLSAPPQPTVVASDAGVQSNCPPFNRGKKSGQVESSDLTEASDLVVSSRNPGVLWSHNDSGGKPRLFAMSLQGRDLGTYHLEPAALEDWEDMTAGPGPIPGASYLYVGDIGANNHERRTISVYRVEEPKVEVDQKAKRRKLDGVTRLDFRYPDSLSRDAETLMMDPDTGDLYIVTKPRHGAPVLYRRRAPFDERKLMALEQVLTLTSIGGGPYMPTLVTAGDIARDGSMILIRTYVHAYLWPRRPNESIETAMQRPPCGVPLHSESQGESIAFALDGRGYYTVSEGNHPVIYFFERGE
jgi:hypothetical protein